MENNFSLLQKSSSAFSLKETASTIDQLDNDLHSLEFEQQNRINSKEGEQKNFKIKRFKSFEKIQDVKEKIKHKNILQYPAIKQKLKKIKIKYIEQVTNQSKQKAKLQSEYQIRMQMNKKQLQSKFKMKAPARIKIQLKKPLEQILEAECEESACKLIEGYTLLHNNQQQQKNLTWWELNQRQLLTL